MEDLIPKFTREKDQKGWDSKIEAIIAECRGNGMPPFCYEEVAQMGGVGRKALAALQSRGLLTAPLPVVEPEPEWRPSDTSKKLYDLYRDVVGEVEDMKLKFPLDREFIFRIPGTGLKTLAFMEKEGQARPTLHKNWDEAIALLKTVYPQMTPRYVRKFSRLFLKELAEGKRRFHPETELRAIKEMLYCGVSEEFCVSKRLPWISWADKDKEIPPDKPHDKHPLNHPLVYVGVECMGGQVLGYYATWHYESFREMKPCELNFALRPCLDFFAFGVPVAQEERHRYAGISECPRWWDVGYLQKISCTILRWNDDENYRILLSSRPT